MDIKKVSLRPRLERFSWMLKFSTRHEHAPAVSIVVSEEIKEANDNATSGSGNGFALAVW